MSIIPAAVHIRLRAEADDRPKGPSVVTPHVGVGLGRGMLDCHHRVNDTRTLRLVARVVGWPEPEPLWSNGPRHIGYRRKALVIARMINAL